MTGKSSGSTTDKQPHNTKDVKITSLRRFLVNFRRPIKQQYDGSFGFDWLRDEYIYDILKVEQLGGKKKRLYKGNVQNLINEYLTFQGKPLPSSLQIKPFNGEKYIPAWLGIFPSTKYSKSANASSLVNVNGVDLFLNIEQEPSDSATPLTDAGTELIFECSTNIQVTPKKIDLKQIIKANRQTKILTSSVAELSSKTVNFYENQSLKINIVMKEASSNPSFVQVIAKNGDKLRRAVGLLMIYPTASIPNAQIVIVHFSTQAGIQKVSTPPNYQLYLKTRSFNQALVRGEIVGESFLNIIDKKIELQNKIKNVPRITNDVLKLQRIQSFLNKYPPNQILDSSKGEQLKKDIISLYELFSQRYVPTGGIDSNDNKKTFVIFTNYKVQQGNLITLGSAMTRERGLFERITCTFSNCPIIWGNAVVLFNQGNTNLETFAHEIGHSFSLVHTFQEGGGAKHTFYQGYTDNLMDYSFIPHATKNLPNQFSGHMWALYKWQWDLLRKDRSITY